MRAWSLEGSSRSRSGCNGNRDDRRRWYDGLGSRRQNDGWRARLGTGVPAHEHARDGKRDEEHARDSEDGAEKDAAPGLAEITAAERVVRAGHGGLGKRIGGP